MTASNHAPHATVYVVGPTASGKSKVGLELARRLEGAVINADSVQVYRYCDVGSAKPSAAERAEVEHRMFDILDPDERLDAYRFAHLAQEEIAKTHASGKIAIVVGGCGLYLRALWQESFDTLPSDAALRAELDQRSSDELYAELCRLDPSRAAQLHRHDRIRLRRAVELSLLLGCPVSAVYSATRRHPPPPRAVIALRPPRPQLHAAIALRCDQMLDSGLIEETERLQRRFPGCWPLRSIGYRQVSEWLHDCPRAKLSVLREAIMARTRQYAKRQCTWFRDTAAQISLCSEADLQQFLSLDHGAMTRQLGMTRGNTPLTPTPATPQAPTPTHNS